MHKTREEGRGRMMRGQGGEGGDVLNTVSLTDWFGKFSQREWAVDKEEDITVTLQCNTVHTERLHTPHDYSMSTSLFASALRFCPGERSEINVSPTWKTKREMKTETLTGADIKAKDKAANRVIECRTKTRFFMNDLKKKKEREREIEGFPCFFSSSSPRGSAISIETTHHCLSLPTTKILISHLQTSRGLRDSGSGPSRATVLTGPINLPRCSSFIQDLWAARPKFFQEVGGGVEKRPWQ